ncbi:MAG TPA: hypothetical protein VGO16_05720 [Pseudonocardiaceae bacterium]|nr:hypothetical protein [Pseudonocardiaceae bacterium]
MFQEQPDVAHRADLQGHAQSVDIGAPQRDQIKIIGIEEEEALQLRPRVGTSWKDPYAAACSSVRNSTGMTANRSDRDHLPTLGIDHIAS